MVLLGFSKIHCYLVYKILMPSLWEGKMVKVLYDIYSDHQITDFTMMSFTSFFWRPEM